MEHWKQPDEGRQQQQQQQSRQQQQLAYQSHKSQTETTSDHNSTIKQPATDPIQSIANVLNHHSKFVQHQKKQSQQLEEQGSKNKLDHQLESGSSALSSGKLRQLKQAAKQKTGANNSNISNDNNNNPSSQDSNSSVACSLGYNQVDQGNSYLYAYNELVTSARASNNKAPGLASGHPRLNPEKGFGESGGGVVVGVAGGAQVHGNNICNHILANTPKTLNFDHHCHHQETLIDSDEDDALSYILHQHRPQEHLLHSIGCTSPAGVSDYYNSYHINSTHNHPRRPLAYEENLHSFDHHLSCSRSSHPRHICGIGGSQNDRLNHIAARLKEESQRAFVLNQKSRNDYATGHDRLGANDIAAIQAHQLTHDLNHIIQNQVTAKGLTSANHHQYVHSNNNNCNNSNSEFHSAAGAIENPAFLLGPGDENGSSQPSDEIINDSSSSSDHSRPNLLVETSARAPRRPALQAAANNSSFFSWLFCGLCNLLCASSPIKHQGRSNLVQGASSNVIKRGRHKRRGRNETQASNESSVVSMYTPSSQQVAGLGQLGGQAGAYYATQTPQAATMHQSHQYAHHHHYPLSSESSLGSSAFANSALRMNAFFRSCCSKKCLFVSCLMLILLIFILVIGLSVYLNFLINLNKSSLMPMSGRLRVDTQGDSFIDQLSNKTSKEFLAKQQQYETILRGAFDRTQNLLKSYPNHLVKCEVYSFKQGSLWVYFRLFVNKRTLMHDTQLMKRKSPDEHLDKQFLPRLTQQTLHSGFEQLTRAFSRELPSTERRSRSLQFGGDSSRQARAFPDTMASLSQRDHVKSFDDQISRLMPIIESIDLQSIQVTPEFDMLQSVNTNSALQQQSMSDNLRASQLLTTAPSAVMVATGDSNNKVHTEADDIAVSTTEGQSRSSAAPPTVRPKSPQSTTREQQQSTPNVTSTESSPPGGRTDEINVSTKKFTLYGYKENSIRPTTSSRPIVVVAPPSRAPAVDQQESLFLVNHQRRKPTVNGGTQTGTARTGGQGDNIIVSTSSNSTSIQRPHSNTIMEIIQARPAVEQQQPPQDSLKEKVVKLVSGQPVVSQANFQRANTPTLRNPDDKSLDSSASNKSITLFAPLSRLEPISTTNFSASTSVPAHLADNSRGGNLRLQKDKTANDTAAVQMIAPYQKTEFSSSNARGHASVSMDSGSANARRPQETSIQDSWNNVLNISKNVTAKSDKPEGEQGSSSLSSSTSSSQPKRLITVTTIGGKNQNFSDNILDWHKISVLSSEISNTIRAQMNTSLATPSASTSAPTTTSATVSSSQKPKVSPHLKQGGSLISTPLKQQESHTFAVLSRDFQQANNSSNTSGNNSNEGQSLNTVAAAGTVAAGNSSQPVSTRLSQSRPSKRPRKPQNCNRNSTSTPNDSQKQRNSKPIIKQNKLKKVAESPHQSSLKNETTNGTSITSKGIRIVDNFLASLDSALNRTNGQVVNQNFTSTANLRPNLNKTQEAFNFNADFLMPTTTELTRSPTANPSSRTTSHLQPDDSLSQNKAASNVEYSTTPSTPTSTQKSIVTTTGSPAKLAASNSTHNKPTSVSVTANSLTERQPTLDAPPASILASPTTRPGTTAFSNQWTPISPDNSGSLPTGADEARGKNRTSSTRRPNLSLIVGPERLPPTVNAPSNRGSQSPFAMSTAILENQLKPTNNRASSGTGSRGFNKLSSTHHVVGNTGSASGGNEFESLRVSRMRLGDEEASSSVLSSPSTTVSTSTLSSLDLDPNTRIVDDFMITTDKIEGNTRGVTLIPPLVLSGLQANVPIARIRAVNPIENLPKRTRGPFAFETLKSATESVA